MSAIGRREFLKATGGAAVAVSLAPERAFGKPPARPPNLVYVFTDQHRVQAMGFMGEDPVVTPNLDRFAAESKVLVNAVSNRPLCTPYRGMLLTGRWPHSTGLTTNCNSSTPETYLRTSERCISDVLADAGYSCGYIGKWHLDTPQGVPKASHWRKAVWDCYTPPGPQRHGFGFWHSYGCSDNHTHPHYWIGGAPEKEKTFFREYSPIHEAGVAAGFIENKGGRQRKAGAPFALFVSMNPPHPPFNKVPDR
jgi:arylsulfatase A-like enzyme